MFLKFDETKELVRMPPMLEGIAAESSESVETMVSFLQGFDGHEEFEQGRRLRHRDAPPSPW